MNSQMSMPNTLDAEADCRNDKHRISKKIDRTAIIRLLFYTAALLSSWLLLSWVKSAPDPALRLMLYPHKLAAEIFYHTSFHYIDGAGYVASGSAYAIGRECMGYNFILLLYAMNACTYVRHFAGLQKLVWMTASFIGAVLAGTFISILRIIGSIPFSGHQDFYLIHLGIGTTIYLFALVADYTILNKLFGRIHHEIQRTP